MYEKGAELIRLYETLVGVEGFRKGMGASAVPRARSPLTRHRPVGSFHIPSPSPPSPLQNLGKQCHFSF